VPGQHNGGNPPPSAIAGVADMVSSTAAMRIKRISVFFIGAPLRGLETLA
jgi:hypothetical protein